MTWLCVRELSSSSKDSSDSKSSASSCCLGMLRVYKTGSNSLHGNARNVMALDFLSQANSLISTIMNGIRSLMKRGNRKTSYHLCCLPQELTATYDLSFWRLKSIRRGPCPGPLPWLLKWDYHPPHGVSSLALDLWLPKSCFYGISIPRRRSAVPLRRASCHFAGETGWMWANKVERNCFSSQVYEDALKRFEKAQRAWQCRKSERNSIERTFSAIWLDLHPFVPLASYIVSSSIRHQPFSQAGWRDLISHFSDSWFSASRVNSRTIEDIEATKQGPGPRRNRFILPFWRTWSEETPSQPVAISKSWRVKSPLLEPCPHS